MRKPNPKPRRTSLPPVLATAVVQFREQVRPAFGAISAAASRVEELMGRASEENATFLGGSLLPMMTYAVLHQAREETEETVAGIEKGEPSDVVDRVDFFASGLSEMAALVKILATMELELGSPLREDWEKVADDLQLLAQRVQQAVEKLEDAIEATEPPDSPFPIIQ